MISAFICLTLITVGIPMIFYVIGGYIEAFRKYYLIQCVLYMLSGVLALLGIFVSLAINVCDKRTLAAK